MHYDRNEFYSKALHYVGDIIKCPDVFVIGAMDGHSFDQLAKTFKEREWSGIFVEPIKYYHDIMIEYHDSLGYPNTNTYINCAISNHNGSCKMITMDLEPIQEGKIMADFGGMSAVYPPKNGMGYEVNKEHVEKYSKIIEVPCKTLNTVLHYYGVNNIDILQIDTEGHDWKILRQLDLNKYRPKIIRVEYANLNEFEKLSLLKNMTKFGYIRQEKLESDVDFYLPEVYNHVISQMEN